MHRLGIFPILMTIAALSGCAGGASSPATGAQLPTQAAPPTAAATATVAPAPTTIDHHASGDAGPPTTTVATTAATGDVGTPLGALSWRDQALRNDAVQLKVAGLATPQPGQSYAAQLVGEGGELPLGALSFTGDIATLSYSAPDAANLLGAYQQITVARSGAAGEAEVVLRGALPAEALRHMRALLVSTPGTPGALGFALGLRQEADTLLQHAQFLREAYDVGDLALVHRHAEHILNIIHGADATDANGDGTLENPGDGFGLLANSASGGYIGALNDTATLAAAARDATEGIRVHAEHVRISGENTRQRVEQIQGLATRILAAQALAATRSDVLSLLALAEQTIQGLDADGDEQVAPAPGEGGVLTAYQHSQLMAQVPLGSSTALAAVPATAPPAATSAPTQVPTEPAASAVAEHTVVVAMSDFAFVEQVLRVKAGTTVVWQNNGVKAHSATAVDASFDTGLLPFGGSQSVTFDTPGTFLYFCETHGTPDGNDGMVGTVIVE
jgi:plastocyanin